MNICSSSSSSLHRLCPQLRGVFSAAARSAPSLIVIDEIDAIGMDRENVFLDSFEFFFFYFCFIHFFKEFFSIIDVSNKQFHLLNQPINFPPFVPHRQTHRVEKPSPPSSRSSTASSAPPASSSSRRHRARSVWTRHCGEADVSTWRSLSVSSDGQDRMRGSGESERMWKENE